MSDSSTETGRVVAYLRDVACWLEAIEEDDASPLAAAALDTIANQGLLDAIQLGLSRTGFGARMRML